MMDDCYDHLRHGVNYMRHNHEVIEPKGHATDLFGGWAVDFFSARQRGGSRFSLYLSYNAPHTPIQPPPDWLERVRRRGLPGKRAELAALIEHMDSSIGRVLEALEASGLRTNTLIIFTSDNGGQLNVGASCGPLRGGKGDMYEGGIRVPMCASWSGRIAASSRSDCVALTMDLYPTICEAAGARPPEGLDGTSILPVLLGKKDPLPQREIVWVRREGGMLHQGRDYYALRRGDWKLLQNSPFEPYQLFNLRQDPKEETDLARREPEV